MSNLQNTLPTESRRPAARARAARVLGQLLAQPGAVGAGIVVIVLIRSRCSRRCSRRTARSSNTATS